MTQLIKKPLPKGVQCHSSFDCRNTAFSTTFTWAVSIGHRVGNGIYLLSGNKI